MSETPHSAYRQTPELSIIIPVYNGGSFFRDTIGSLLGQTLERSRFEIILVDDGSTDGSAEYCDKLAASHPDFVRVFHQPNSGSPAGPRNKGARLARGEYVFFVDADDLVPAESFEHMLLHAHDKQFDIGVFKVDGSSWGLTYDGLFDQPQDNCTVFNSRIMNSLGPYKLFRRSLILDNNLTFPEGILYEDLPFVLECYLNARSISIITDKVYYTYSARTDGGSISQGVGAKRLDEQIEGIAHYFRVASRYATPQECPHIFVRGYRYLDYALPHLFDQKRTDLLEKAARDARSYYCDQVRSLMPFSQMTRIDTLIAGKTDLLRSIVKRQPLLSFNGQTDVAPPSYQLHTLNRKGLYAIEAEHVAPIPPDFGWGRPKLENPQIVHNLITHASLEADSVCFEGRLQLLRACAGIPESAQLRSSLGNSHPASFTVESARIVYADVWHIVLSWQATMPLSTLEPKDDKRQAIHFYLDVDLPSGQTVESRFGKDRLDGVFSTFAKQAVTSGAWLFAPTETSSKNLSLNAVPLALARSLANPPSLRLEKKVFSTLLYINGGLGFDNYPGTEITLQFIDESGSCIQKETLKKSARRGDRAFFGSADVTSLRKGRYELSLSVEIANATLDLEGHASNTGREEIKRFARTYSLDTAFKPAMLTIS
ncbi:MAG: glycosyltransferase [Eggerthellaceae bacterium]|nr:glycosyltransferase [Eggerthellaceae bacterium]